jgi:hypothetical protein
MVQQKGEKIINYLRGLASSLIIIVNKDLVKDHLGKHPVIHLDFKNASTYSVENAKNQRVYRNHSYLKTNTTLVPVDEKGNTTAQVVYKKWCNDERARLARVFGIFAQIFVQPF